MAEAKNRGAVQNTEILLGRHAVKEALRAGRRKVYEIYLLNGKQGTRWEPILETARQRGVPVRATDPEAFRTRVQSDRHQGIAARVGGYPFVELAGIIENAKMSSSPPFLLMIDCVMDPQNLGALIRTAACAGVDGICIPKDRSASPTPSVCRASAGAMEHVPMAKVTNMARCLSQLKAEGFWIIGLDPSAGASLFSTELTAAVAMVIGGEAKGLRPLVRKSCDLLVSIPQSGKIDSLNAAAAGAVAMYEVVRQRLGQSRDR